MRPPRTCVVSTPHLVVEDENGDLFDLTPSIGPERYPFLKSRLCADIYNEIALRLELRSVYALTA
jgi:hypothetical protein